MEEKPPRPRGRPPGKTPASKRILKPKRRNERDRLKAAKAQIFEAEAEKSKLSVPESNDLQKPESSYLPDQGSSNLYEEGSSDLHKAVTNPCDMSYLVDSLDISQEDAKPPEVIFCEEYINSESEESPLKLKHPGKGLVEDKITLRVQAFEDSTTSDLQLLGSSIKDPMSLLIAERAVVVEVEELLAERVRALLPPGWTVQLFPGLMYTLLVTSPPFRVNRAICFHFNGEISVEVGGKTLPRTHDIYTDPMLQSPSPLSYETLDSFASAVRKAAYAVQSYRKCVGVDADNSVEEWTKHPVCKLDDQEDGKKVLRIHECSLLISRSRKRCTLCYQYQDILKRREARRGEGTPGEVHEKTPHSLLSPRRLKTVLRAKQAVIRTQAAQLKQLRERVAKRFPEEN